MVQNHLKWPHKWHNHPSFPKLFFGILYLFCHVFYSNFIKNKIVLIKKGEIDSRQRHVFLNEKGKRLFEEMFLEQKKRIYNALKKSDSDSVIKFKNVLNKIINE